MNITVISTTKPGNVTPVSDFETLSGHCAGVCYMANNFETLQTEKPEKTARRVKQTMEGGHHSVFDHNYITLYLEGIPKLLAMFLNNEKMYTTSEKSARYTVMDNVSPLEQELYNKWKLGFEQRISEKYSNLPKKKIEKLAMENARYMLSVFTPTCMVYTVTYRQINYLYQWLDDIADITQFGAAYNTANSVKVWQNAINELKTQLVNTGYINPELRDYKSRTFSLFTSPQKVVYTSETLGDVYSICYVGSYAQLAQAQRHRTLNYSICEPDETNKLPVAFFVPPILGIGQKMEWIKDCEKLLKEGIVPQAKLIYIREQGTYEDFILKCKERLCSAAQLEIALTTQEILERYITTFGMKATVDPDMKNHWIWQDLHKYNTGRARCSFPDFKCTEPCGWADGINMNREI